MGLLGVEDYYVRVDDDKLVVGTPLDSGGKYFYIAIQQLVPVLADNSIFPATSCDLLLENEA